MMDGWDSCQCGKLKRIKWRVCLVCQQKETERIRRLAKRRARYAENKTFGKCSRCSRECCKCSACVRLKRLVGICFNCAGVTKPVRRKEKII